jgi:hypothetical protein
MSDPTAPLPPVEPPPLAAATTIEPPPPYVPVPTAAGSVPPARGGRAGLVVASVAAGLLLLGAGFGLGRLSAPSGPASLIDAVRMAQQGQLPCGPAPRAGRGAGLLGRVCPNGPARSGGFGPWQGGPRSGGNPNGSAPTT